jgi:hypothetical protein
LRYKHFPAGSNGFFRAPLLLTGATEALLIDGGFTYPDGRALTEDQGHRQDAHHDLHQPIRPGLLFQPEAGARGLSGRQGAGRHRDAGRNQIIFRKRVTGVSFLCDPHYVSGA